MAKSDDQHRAGGTADRPEITPSEPDHGPRARAAKALRQARLAAEMRANLTKRKAQARARQSRDGDRSP